MGYSVPGQARIFCVLAFLPLAVLARTEVYVPLGSANAVAVVDTDEDQVIAEILGVPASHGLAVSWDGRFLVAGSLAERPDGVLPPKPGVMPVDEHAAHHEVGTPYVPDPAEKSKSVGSVIAMKRQIDEPSFKDPVCGMEVSLSTAADECEYRGKAFYFCASACREAFEAEPGKYVQHHRQHGVKPK